MIKIKKFDKLLPHELYAILQIRLKVFIIEQNCIYNDLDNFDAKAYHIYYEEEGVILSVGRILPPNTLYPTTSIGRLATLPHTRNRGLASKIIQHAITFCEDEYQDIPIKIMAQAYLEKYYNQFGFIRNGDNFDEDGIAHCYMIRS